MAKHTQNDAWYLRDPLPGDPAGLGVWDTHNGTGPGLGIRGCQAWGPEYVKEGTDSQLLYNLNAAPGWPLDRIALCLVALRRGNNNNNPTTPNLKFELWTGVGTVTTQEVAFTLTGGKPWDAGGNVGRLITLAGVLSTRWEIRAHAVIGQGEASVVLRAILDRRGGIRALDSNAGLVTVP